MTPVEVHWSGGMPRIRVPKYSVAYRTHAGLVFSQLEFEAPHDKAAMIKADTLDVPSISAGYDLRQGERLVVRVKRHCH